MSNQYKCNFCSRNYKEKFNYDRHISVCKFLSQTPRQQDNEIELSSEIIPSTKELFQLVKHLSMRVDKLEKENQQLKQQQNKKINILEWLNKSNNKPIILFELWIIDTIQPKIIDTLETVFHNDLTTAIIKLFNDCIEQNDLEHIPICSFAKKNSQIYVYDKDREDDNDIKWIALTNKEIDKYIDYISNQYISVFINDWYKPNQKNIEESEKYKNLYAEYYQKVLGGTVSKETRNTKIKKFIYNKLKRTISNVIEYEC